MRRRVPDSGVTVTSVGLVIGSGTSSFISGRIMMLSVMARPCTPPVTVTVTG